MQQKYYQKRLKKKNNIYFRADGNSHIGLGHVIRSLALAEMLNDNFECHFAIRNPLATLKVQILEVCHSLIELPETENNETEALIWVDKWLTGNEIVVLDGYHFQTSYQQIIKNKGCKLVCIDDIHSYHFVADVVINHAGGVSQSQYSTEVYTQLFLGLQFSLIRKPFREATTQLIQKNYSSVLITMGGADPKNDTLHILAKCINTHPGAAYNVVIGTAYQYRLELELFIRQSVGHDIKIFSALNAKQMADLMCNCGIAITSPSTVAYEFLATRGALFLNIIADNQIDIFSYFIKENLAFSFDQYYDVSMDNIQKSQLKQQSVLDNRIQERYLSIFKNLSHVA